MDLCGSSKVALELERPFSGIYFSVEFPYETTPGLLGRFGAPIVPQITKHREHESACASLDGRISFHRVAGELHNLFTIQLVEEGLSILLRYLVGSRGPPTRASWETKKFRKLDSRLRSGA